MRLLIVGVSNGLGGIEKIIHDIVLRLYDENITIDFIALKKTVACQEEYENAGSKIFPITKRSENFCKHFKELKKFFKNNVYDYVWCHTSSCASIAVQVYAKRYSNAKVITHSHGTSFSSPNILAQIVNCITDFFNRPRLNRLSDYKFACSKEAGISLYGKKSENEIIVVNNGVDLQKFKFSEEKRNKIREELGFDGLMIGNIGRFIEQKNHRKIIGIFAEFVKLNRDAKLVLASEGELLDEIKHLTAKMRLEDKVVFLGSRNDIDELLSAFDILLMPSLFEGLPVVGVEAQASGLKCIFSDTISHSIQLLEETILVPLEETDEEWARIMHAQTINTDCRSEASNVLYDKGYDVSDTATMVKKILLDSEKD